MTFVNYANVSGRSGVVQYEITALTLKVRFWDEPNLTYVYSQTSVGAGNLDIMKNLAVQGYGLNAFIVRNVYYKYTQKIWGAW